MNISGNALSVEELSVVFQACRLDRPWKSRCGRCKTIFSIGSHIVAVEINRRELSYLAKKETCCGVEQHMLATFDSRKAALLEIARRKAYIDLASKGNTTVDAMVYVCDMIGDQPSPERMH